MVTRTIRLAFIAACLSSGGCAGTVIRPASPAKPAAEALLVLPGLGYGRGGEQVFKTLAASAAREGLDLYVPKYISRGGLAKSRDNLQRFIREHGLERYERVHVFAFLAGGWTLNPLDDLGRLKLATVVYDRSPFQERAPRVAAEKLGPLAWLKYGSIVSDLAKTPYSALPSTTPRVAIVVETKPTSFITRFASTARSYGPYRFDCGSFGERYDDCAYVAMDHGETYIRFEEIWPELLAFIRTGRFTASADRNQPSIRGEEGRQ